MKTVAPARLASDEQAVERLLHERIEAFGWLVQYQQRRFGLESLDDSQFALHAGAVFTQPPPQVAVRQFQSVTEFLSVSFVHRVPVEAGKEIERFQRRQVEAEAQFSGQVPDSRPGLEALRPAVITKDKCFAGAGPEQIEQQTDRGGLARAIQPEEAKNLAPVNVEVEVVQGGERPVSFRQAANRNGGRGRALRAGARALARRAGNDFLRFHRRPGGWLSFHVHNCRSSERY